MSDVPASGPSERPPTKKETVDKWLNKTTYLEYETKQDLEILRKTSAIKIGEFLELLHTSGPRAWFLDESIDLSLSLLTDMKKKSNCFVLPIWDATQLCVIGSGARKVEASDDLLRESLQVGGKRWIIVPCNDGMLPAPSTAMKDDGKKGDKTKKGYKDGDRSIPSTPEETTDTSEQAKEGEPKVGEEESLPVSEESGKPKNASERGAVKSKTAKEGENEKSETDEPRSNDSEETDRVLKYSGTHWGLMIIDTETEVARWFDGLLDIKYKTRNGRRVASINHMLNAGTAAGKVLCGYDRILGRERGRFTTSTLKWVPHQNSDNTTAHDSGACGPHMFACLNHVYQHPRALEDLHAHFKKRGSGSGRFSRGQRGFSSRATRQKIQDMIRTQQESTKTADELPLCLDPRMMEMLGLNITVQQLLAALNQINGNENLNEEEPDKASDKEYRAQYEEAKKNNTLPRGIVSLAQFAEHVRYLKIEEANRAKGTKDSALTTRLEIDGIIYDIPRNDPKAWKSPTVPKTGVPRNTTKLPDFAHMDDKTLTQWLNLKGNKSTLDKSKTDKARHSSISSKAVLHMKYKKTFLSEPDADFENVWVFDTAVFNTGQEKDRLGASRIKYMLMRHYEPETLTYIQQYKSKKRDHDGGEHGRDPKKAKTTSLWVTCDDKVVENNLTDDIRADPRARDNDMMTYRALLFLNEGGRFEKEDDATCLSFWINTPGIFREGRDYIVRDGKRQCTRGPRFIRDMMVEAFTLDDDDDDAFAEP
ncbi:hypothetical protein HBH56_078300 [Parastagonospora nodorum]|uniref:Ubiquitin-like protease family profile domain-containing protein n=1 Tax=Phaeosphaeria nodorum (strain SN15 / ATCC MYA-4574 / FGSC 10173) TaxID=321614 RepID=A0A7U2IBY9_PHANO|nr:hypothetical protein HBH56_078300 [Parastagonospora nodorum]QRD07008.1 hypothetical protein JI435_125890 [Parastagonospora nodorum SN15]KAH3923377.1 hypothetical protein HBH54_209640 [Parastagonospora nodorum]KAH3981891.1 hypothetical protein HBH51_045200 [Parastagonospora nodorum]KAH4069869.1 hypothetical protein HBH50_105570 [Parastagonospora nodorum]